jgi:predicted adenylyl cyclase CyaB
MNGNVLSEQKINLKCEDLKKAKELFEYVDFKELVRVKYHVTVYSDGNTEYAFQEVENLGTLIEYENINDFDGKTIEDINKAKEEMYNEIVKKEIKVTEEKDVKKAYELIVKKLEKE